MIGSKFVAALRYQAEKTARLSNDPHTKVGAAIMSGKVLEETFIQSTGFNEILAPHDPASFTRPLKYDRVIHAEIMAIGHSAGIGEFTRGAIMYVTHPPCICCATAIRAAGIRHVICGGASYASDTPAARAAVSLIFGSAVIELTEAEAMVFEF